MIVATQLQPVELTDDLAHPDRAVLDRISDPAARRAYELGIEQMERERWDSTMPRWPSDEEEG